VYDRRVTQVQGRGRAAALPIEERRSAIVAATLPLFLDQGASVTTREIAQAAGIAEGTIFRVFADKTELLEAVVEAALDIAPTSAAIAAIDEHLSFEEKLVAAVDILRERVLYVFRVYSAASDSARNTTNRRSTDLPALTAIFAESADRLSCEPEVAARILRGLTVTCVHPTFGVTEPFNSADIVETLLHGIHRTDEVRG
jgi:AcrR family transcriptional regulator